MARAAVRFLFYTGIGYWVFDMVHFIGRRLGDDPPDGMGLFLSLSLPIIFFFLPWIAERWRKGYLLGSVLIAYLIGILFFSHPGALALSFLLGMGLGVKAAEAPEDSGKIFAWFVGGMMAKGVVFLLFFFSSYEPGESMAFFLSFLPYLLLLFIMYGLFPFNGSLKITDPRVAKAWGIWNGRLFMGAVILLLTSSLLGFLITYLWNGVLPVLGRFFSILLASLFSFYPALKERVNRVMPPQAEVGIEGSGERSRDPLPPPPESAPLPILDLIVTGVFFLLFFLLLYVIGRVLWRWMGEGMRVRKRVDGGDGTVLREPLSSRGLPRGSKGESDRAGSHQNITQPIRLRMMSYLRLLKGEGKWDPSVTVGRLVNEGKLPGLPASLYEKMRYGEEALTAEEERMVLTALEREIQNHKHSPS